MSFTKFLVILPKLTFRSIIKEEEVEVIGLHILSFTSTDLKELTEGIFDRLGGEKGGMERKDDENRAQKE